MWVIVRMVLLRFFAILVFFFLQVLQSLHFSQLSLLLQFIVKENLFDFDTFRFGMKQWQMSSLEIQV